MHRHAKSSDASVWSKIDSKHAAHVAQKFGNITQKIILCAGNVLLSPSVKLFNPLPGPYEAFNTGIKYGHAASRCPWFITKP